MAGPVFVDTWGWIALGHRRDPSHKDVKDFYRNTRDAGTLLHTSDYILDEVATLLFRREPFDEAVRFMEGVFAAADQGQLSIERIHSRRFSAAWTLRRRYRDKPRISFTDLTSIVLMTELGLTDVLTQDDHFVQVNLGFQTVP